MTSARFSAGTRFFWQGANYQVKRLLPDDKINIEDVATEAVMIADRTVLVKALFSEELRLETNDRQSTMPGQPSCPGDEAKDLADYPQQLVERAKFRREVILPLVQMNASERTKESVACRIAEVRETNPDASLSVPSVYRWLRDFTNSGNDLRSLVYYSKKRGGKGQHRLQVEAEQVIQAVIDDKLFTRETVSVNDIHHEVAVRVAETNVQRPDNSRLSLPSRRTVARRVAAVDSRALFAAKHGKRAAKRQFTQYGQMEYPLLPLERVEIDHTKTDLIVIDDNDNLPLGRLTLTYCLDTATSYPLGYYLGFEGPGYRAAMECVFHSICPKEDLRAKYGAEHDWIAYGVPTTLIVDNGREFVGKDLSDACLALGIVLQPAPVQTPEFKAGAERHFGTFNTQFFHTLPGTTFSNYGKRGDYKSAQAACIYLSQIDRMLNLYLIDIYAESFHKGLNGIPARAWEAATRAGFSPRLPSSARDLLIVLGRVEERSVHSYGIELHGLKYNCSDLARFRDRPGRGDRVKVKYHPGDISRVHVYDPDEDRYIEVPALAQEYTHELSLWKHRVIQRFLRSEQDEENPEALGRAKRKLMEIVQEGKERKELGGRTRVARFETGGRPIKDVVERYEEPEQDRDQGRSTPNAVQGGAPTPAAAPASSTEKTPVPTADEADEQWSIVYKYPTGRSAK